MGGESGALGFSIEGKKGKEKKENHFEPEEACRLAVLARGGDINALNDLLKRAEPYIAKVASGFLTKDDNSSVLRGLTSAGQEGLYRFVISDSSFFDNIGPENEANRKIFFKFSNFWIVKYIRNFSEQKGSIPVTVGDSENLKKLNKIRGEYRKKNLGEQPSIEYLIDRMGFNTDNGEKRINFLLNLKVGKRVAYLENSVLKGGSDDENDFSLSNKLHRPEENPEELAYRKEVSDKVRDFLLGSDASKAMDIVNMVCGLNGVEKKTIDEIAKEMNIAPKEVNRIFKKGRELYIVESVYGLNGRADLTFEELGQELGVSRQRAEQILKEVVPALRSLLK